MAESNAAAEIARFDKALAQYYKSMGKDDYKNEDGKGKFAASCEENEVADSWDDEMEALENRDFDGSLLLDFDADFPYNSSDKNENEMKNKIMDILKLLKDGKKLPISSGEQMKLNEAMFKNITDQHVDDNLAKYQEQMKSFITVADKDKELKWFLGVSDQTGYPFLSYMVDSFTMDRAKKNAKEGLPLHLNEWVLANEFVKALTKKDPSRGQKLKQAMVSYSNRLMNRLHIGSPTFKIKDDIKENAEYLVSISEFISRLLGIHKVENMEQKKLVQVKAPFQVDLMIAVKDTIKTVKSGDDADDDDDSDDDDDDEPEQKEIKVEDPSIDHIGPVRSKLKDYPLLHFPKKNIEAYRDIAAEEVEALARLIGGEYDDFRTALSKAAGNEKGDDDDSKQSYPDLEFDAKSYPQHRRFSIFVDRRYKGPKKDQEDEKDKDKDQITFFQPPTKYSTMPTGHVPEIGFEFLRECLIPDKVKHISAKDEQIDEIKCYIVWNGQCMRFEPEHITEVLPYLFPKNKQNEEFKKKGGSGDELIEMYKKLIEDRPFRMFYQTLLDWKLE